MIWNLPNMMAEPLETVGLVHCPKNLGTTLREDPSQPQLHPLPWGELLSNQDFGMFPKIGGNPPKMDGFVNGKPLSKWMIAGENPLFSETSI